MSGIPNFFQFRPNKTLLANYLGAIDTDTTTGIKQAGREEVIGSESRGKGVSVRGIGEAMYVVL